MADPAGPAEPKDPVDTAVTRADTAVTEGPAAADGTPDGEAGELAGSPGSDAFGVRGSGGAADAWPAPPGAVATYRATGTGALRSAARLGLRPSAPRRRANWQRVPGVLFAAVTILPAVLVMAWLIPGLPLLLAGRFAGIPMIVISVPLGVALVVMVLRELPSAWPHGIRDIRDDDPPAESPANQVAVRPEAPPESGDRAAGPAGRGSGTAEAGTGAGAESRVKAGTGAGAESRVKAGTGAGAESRAKAGTGAQPDGLEAGLGAAAEQPDTGKGPDSWNQPDTGNGPDSRRRRPDVPWWALAATILVAAGFAVWQYAENSQQIIVLRDPGTYLQFADWIAGHGSTRIPQSLQAFGGAHQGLTFASLGFFQVGTTVVPQFMAGLPMTLAIGVWAGGPLGAAAMAPVLGACAVLAFAGLVGRLAGARWAPAAALVLAVSLPQQYTSRTTFSETLAQVMLYGGLCMLADSFVLPGGRHAAAYAGPPSWRDGPAPNVTLAFFAGLSLGLTLLIRIDGLSDLLPAIPFLGILLVRRRPQGIPFGIGLFIGAAYGFADGYLLSRPYLDSIGPSLRPLAMIALGAVALTVIGMGVMSARRPRSWLRFVSGAPPLRWLPEAAAALTVLAVVGFAVRPYFQTVRGETDPATISYVAELQRLAHLAVDPTRQYSEDSLYWVIWYIGVPAVILGAIGLALLARRCLRALLTGRDSGAARIWALPLMIISWVTVTVLWRPGIIPDQPWASRRLVPVVLPGLILAAIWASAWIKERGRKLGAGRPAESVVAVCCVLALLVPAAVTTFGVGTTKTATGSARLTADGLAFKRTGAGEDKAVRQLCASIGPNASVVILDPLTADRFSQVIRNMCATPAARMDAPAPASVASVVAGIERTGRRPILLAAQQSQLAEYGGSAQQVLNLLTTQDAHELTQPPTRTWLIHFVIWMTQPSRVTAGAVTGKATGVTGAAVTGSTAEYSRRA